MKSMTRPLPLALVQQTGSIEQAARELGIDSLEPDAAGHAF